MSQIFNICTSRILGVSVVHSIDKWFVFTCTPCTNGLDLELVREGDNMYQEGERVTSAKLGCHPHNEGELEGLHLAILLAVVELGHFG